MSRPTVVLGAVLLCCSLVGRAEAQVTEYSVGGPVGADDHTVVDWDGDGRLDLVLAIEASSGVLGAGVHWYWNQGGQIDVPAVQSTLAGPVTAVGAGDSNRDGVPELVVGLSQGMVQLWESDDSMVPAHLLTQTSTPLGPSQVGLFDFTSDGYADLAWISEGAAHFLDLSSPAPGPPTFDLPPQAGEIDQFLTADFDRDGDLDFVTVVGPTQGVIGQGQQVLSTVQFWFRDGPSFGAAPTFELVLTAHDVGGLAAGDFDADGNLDLALSLMRPTGLSGEPSPREPLTAEVVVFLPFEQLSGSAVSADYCEYECTGGRCSSVAVGDWFGDGEADLALFEQGSSSSAIGVVQFLAGADVRACIEAGSGSLTSADDFAVFEGGADLSFADLDGDGQMELIAVADSEKGILVYTTGASPADGGVQEAEGGSQAPTLGAAVAFASVDGDNDGLDELWVLADGADVNHHHISVWAATGQGWVASHTFDFNSAKILSDLVVADLNADGLDDVLVTTSDNTQDLFFEAPPGDPNWLPLDPLFVDSATLVAEALDVDLDGDLDVLRLDAARGLVLNQNSLVPSGQLGDALSSLLASDSVLFEMDGLQAMALADLDGDGDLDVALCGEDMPVRVVRNSAVSPSFDTPDLPSLVAEFELLWSTTEPWSCSDIEWADFDGDGLLDLVVAGPLPLGLDFYRADSDVPGSGWLSWEPDGVTLSPADQVEVGDVNRDGLADLVLTVPLSARLGLLLLGTPTGFTATQITATSTLNGALLIPGGEFPVTGYPLVLADKDADGDLDVVFGASWGGDPTSTSLHQTFRNVRFGEIIHIESPTLPRLLNKRTASTGTGSNPGDDDDSATASPPFESASESVYWSSPVRLGLALMDPDLDPVASYKVQFSLDGSTWETATLLSPPQLLESSSPLDLGPPTVHSLRWDAAADLFGEGAPARRSRVLIRFVVLAQVQAVNGTRARHGSIASNTISLSLASCLPFDSDGDGVFCDLDCDDEDPDRRPAAVEVCDGVDNDCDPETGPVGFGSPGAEADLDGDGYLECGPEEPDCNDEDAAIHPDAEELCDGLDNDCNDLMDAGSPGEAAQESDEDSDGYSECEGDCDDGQDDWHPDAVDLPGNLVDEDCDGRLATVCFFDGDGDGFGGEFSFTADLLVSEGETCDTFATASSVSGDCDDSDPAISPAAEEDCSDPRDNDCDGLEALVGDDPTCWPTSCLGCSAGPRFAPRGIAGWAALLVVLGLRRRRGRRRGRR